MKRIFGAIAFFLLLIILWLLFSPASSRWLAQRWLGDDLIIHCLEYSPESLLSKHLQRVCVSTPSFDVDARGIRYDQHLSRWEIAAVGIKKRPVSADNSPDTPLRLPNRPSQFPPFVAKQVNVQLSPDTPPLTFSLQHDGQFGFQLQQDWKAMVNWRTDGVELELTSSTAPWLPWLPEHALPYLAGIQEKAPWQVTAALSDQGIEASVNIDAALHHALNERCTVQAILSGTVAITADWAATQVVANAASLENQWHWQGCQMTALDASPPAVAVTLPDPVTFSANTLSVPQMVVSPTELPDSTLVVHDIAWQPGGALSAALEGQSRDLASLLNLPIQAEQLAVVLKGTIEGPSVDKLNLSLAPLTMTAQRLAQDGMTLFDSRLNLRGNATKEDLTLQGDIHINRLESQSLAGQGLTATLDLKGTADTQVTLNIAPTIDHLDVSELSLSGDARWQLVYTPTEEISATGTSHIAKLVVANRALPAISLTHSLNFTVDDNHYTSHHQWQLPTGLHGEAVQQGHRWELTVPEQEATLLAPLLQSEFPSARITGGNISFDAMYDTSTRTGLMVPRIAALSGRYQEYIAKGITLKPTVYFDSASFQLVPSTVKIDSVDVGVMLTDLTAQLDSVEQSLRVQNIDAQVLGGRLNVDSVYLDQRDQGFNLTLDALSLPQMMAMQQAAGVQGAGFELTGNISGNIPVSLQGGQAQVQDATLNSEQTGRLTIRDNAAFEGIKQQQPSLAKQLSVLETLQIDSLTSTLNLAPSGNMVLAVAIKGQNPEQQVPVNFNYTHEQNLYTLMRALRLADQIEKTVGENATQRRQH
ncbi:YdbH domain-containing protein [Aestuariibacter halophilus]|uniref:YdbH domain-containing protein n=1 Tax=Fluctibacter halophilus TaxID=226011 RepID=A0ABS8G4G2_9ALTE|nr:YdbH domain-containing protein [Aestuariibacter halophilus]MCC2615394.1 YdbH domain-containing protein [Aestuariibacter halophilus]